MAQQPGWTPDDVQKILVNPIYCLAQPPVISEEQWITAGTRLIAEIGSENYLRALVAALKASH